MITRARLIEILDTNVKIMYRESDGINIVADLILDEIEKSKAFSPDSTGPAELDLGEPVVWVVPGDDTANCNGYVDAMCIQEGEFTRPLYAAPQIVAALTPSAPIAARPALSDVLAAVEARRTHDPEHDARVTDYEAIEALSEAASIAAPVRDDGAREAFERWFAKTSIGNGDRGQAECGFMAGFAAASGNQEGTR